MEEDGEGVCVSEHSGDVGGCVQCSYELTSTCGILLASHRSSVRSCDCHVTPYLQLALQVLQVSIAIPVLCYPHYLHTHTHMYTHTHIHAHTHTHAQSSEQPALTSAPISLHGNRLEWCSNGLTNTTCVHTHTPVRK